MVTDDKEILELISNGELEIVGRLVDASNASLLCKIAESTQVIYKPIAGERPLWDFPDGNLASREVATYYLQWLYIAHHMPTSARAYLEAGAMSITMGNARQNYSRVGHRVPHVYLRGHRHTGGIFNDGNGIFMVTPAWQLLTRYGHKVVGDAICRPGIGILDWRGCEKGDLPATKLIQYAPKETTPIRS